MCLLSKIISITSGICNSFYKSEKKKKKFTANKIINRLNINIVFDSKSLILLKSNLTKLPMHAT